MKKKEAIESSDEELDELAEIEESKVELAKEIEEIKNEAEKNSGVINEKKKKRLEKIKQKMERRAEKLKKKLAKKAARQEKRRQRANQKAKGGRKCGNGRGRGMPEFVKCMIDQNKQWEEEHGTQRPRLRDLIKTFKEDHPEFKRNPSLTAKLFEKVGDNIKEILNNAAQEVINENPELVAEGKKRRDEVDQKMAEFKAEKPEELPEEIQKRLDTVLTVFPDASVEVMREEVQKDFNEGKSTQDTIQRLLAIHSN